jgi:Lon-like protease
MEKSENGRGWRQPWIKWVVLAAVLFALNFIQLPYYFSVPGEAQELAEVIEVEDGFEYEGSFALTTIQMGKANTVNYVWSLLSERRELMHEDEIRPPGESDEMYHHRQMMLMSSSQEQAILVAYKAAGKEAEFEEYGVLVTGIISEMDAADKLQAGDLITSINGEEVKEVNDMLDILSDAEISDQVEVSFEREEESRETVIEIQEFPEEYGADSGSGGLGISNPVTDRELKYEPEVTIDTNQIGGPSAGLMFSLEIYNQLTEEDITRGLQIAGTGSIDEDGNVGRIGGVKQKVYASDEEGTDVFFVPVEEGMQDTNYEIATNTADSIDTDMEIVPVGSFDEALDYLLSIEP